MSEDVDGPFHRFVAAERPALLAEALRLTGDPARAEDAVQAALARTRRRWGRAGHDPRATADAALADRLAGWRGRLLGGEQVVESLDAPRAPALPPVPARWRLGTEAAVADALRRARRHRRLRAGAGVAAACAAVVAAAALVPADEEIPAPVDSAVDVPAEVPLLTGPTRGSLAGDRAFVEAVRRVPWGPLVSPPVAERRVVLATDTPAGRVVLVVGTVDEDVRGVWLTGPAGAAPDQLGPYVPRHLGPHRPASLLVGGPGPATLVVVAGRDDEIDVSSRLQVGPRGTVRRTYEPVDDVDGVAVLPVQATAGGTGTSIRVRRDGQVVHRSGVEAPGLPATVAPASPPLVPLRPVTVQPAPRSVTAALTQVAVPLGVEPAALEPELLWSGPLPLGRGLGTVAVVVARSPGGGLVVATWVARAGPAGGGEVLCGVHTPAGTTEVAGLVVARICDLTAPGSGLPAAGRWLVVTAPATGAAVLDERGVVLATAGLGGGGAVLPLPAGAHTVRTVDDAGRAIREVPVLAPATVPFGDYGGGTVR